MKHKRRLVYIIHGIIVGGAEIAFLSALPKLDDAFDLKVYVLGRSDLQLMSTIDTSLRERIVCFNLPNWVLLCYSPFIYLNIRSFKPDIVISSLWRSTIPAMLYKALHRHTRYYILLHSSNFFHWVDRFFTRRAMRVCDAVFADSLGTKAFAISVNGTRTPVNVLSYLTQQTPEKPNAMDFSGAKKFLFVGRLNKVKRVPLAVSAIAWLREHGVDASLAIYGRDDGDREAVEQQIRQTGMQAYVHIKDVVSPTMKREIYQAYNFYIQLSAQEGMAMSVAEAMQRGMVCFVTPVGEISHYAQDGVSAVFAYPGTTGSWDETMKKLLVVVQNEEVCHSISRAAHQTFCDRPVFSDSLIENINKV